MSLLKFLQTDDAYRIYVKYFENKDVPGIRGIIYFENQIPQGKIYQDKI